ncbi:MAG: YggS family pyridoxal phosphate-dependent enzyme [Oscillospiraceae bacterium]|nr:YggS family pyridoxal phosphate-dependent enzyme [Oscillospiraceae bacterium]
MSIAENVGFIKSRIEKAAIAAQRAPDEIILVAATKMNSAEKVAQAISAGVSVCGENRVQELLEKKEQNAYNGAKLHFIGHLQSNKVKQIVGACDLIQSVDSLELLSLIDARAAALGIRQEVLLEINIGREASKSGIYEHELPVILEKASSFSSVFIRGIMAIPPISNSTGENRAYFARMCQLFIDNSTKKYDNISMDFLSMGMSDDFEDAIAEGSNMVRVGSAIFGARAYPERISLQ